MRKIMDKFLFRDEADKLSICNAIDSLQLSGTSKWIKDYEEKLASFFKCKYAVAISSGTSAIHCALYASNVKEGDEVIVPPTAPMMTALPILELKANPIFVDTNLNNFGYDIEDLRKKITSKTKAIICVPMWGYPFEYDEIKEICKSNKIALIEDAAQAHGSEINNQYVGTISDIGCFSTHDKKLLSTGEGGFILTNIKEYYEKIKSFIQFDNMSGNNYGTNFKLSTLQAAIGITGIDRIKWQLEKRRQNAQYIKDNIKNKKVQELLYNDNIVPNYYSMVLQFENNITNRTNKFIDAGIPTEINKYKYQCMYNYKVFERWKNNCKNAEKLTKSIETIPVHPNITKEDLDYMIKFINEI